MEVSQITALVLKHSFHSICIRNITWNNEVKGFNIRMHIGGRMSIIITCFRLKSYNGKQQKRSQGNSRSTI